MYRERTHWCNDRKHEKCGGYVKYYTDPIDSTKQKCACNCHAWYNQKKETTHENIS